MSEQKDSEQANSEASVVSRILSPSIQIQNQDDTTAVKIPVAASVVGVYFMPGLIGLGLIGGLAAKIVGKKIKIEV